MSQQSSNSVQDSSSQSQPDILVSDIAKANFKDLKAGVAWRIKDIHEAASQITQITEIYWDDYPSRVNLKRANANLRDILSKLEEIQQYMSQ